MTTTHTQPAVCDLDSAVLEANPLYPTLKIALGSLYLHDADESARIGKMAREAVARAAQAPQRAPYSPDNPPRLRKDGESVQDYHIAMGWDKPTQAPQGDTRQGAPVEQIARVILHLIGECAMDWKAGPTGDPEEDAFHSNAEELNVLVDLVNKALASPAAHTCTPADEQAETLKIGAPDPLVPNIETMSGQRIAICIDEVTCLRMVEAYNAARAAQGAGTAPADTLRKSVRAIVQLVRDGEWADLLDMDEDAVALWDAVDGLLQRGAGTAPVGVADDLRAAGWAVAVHNDYRLNGEAHTFWLFTKDGRAVKGEGKTDAEALAQVREAVGLVTPPATVSTAAAPELTVKLAEMRESNGNVTWNVLLVKAGDSLVNGHSVYTDRIKGRAEYEADSLRHFLGQGPYPDMLAYATDPPIAEVSTAAATTASASAPKLECAYPNCGCTSRVTCNFNYDHSAAPTRAADGQQGTAAATADAPVDFCPCCNGRNGCAFKSLRDLDGRTPAAGQQGASHAALDHGAMLQMAREAGFSVGGNFVMPAGAGHITDALERFAALLIARAPLPGQERTAAARDVLAERQRQVSAEGWNPEHDDSHTLGELADAAGCYALHAHDWPSLAGSAPLGWPWDAKWWKPAGARRNLEKAGALILAEIERLDRAQSDTTGGSNG
jgi:hypothetical protein